ncbi:MAG: hypothetical protein HY726_03915 [Candidatus Rokubacteria bacterium]|nr:hypothetical protein [Candidatus Rokubacteria bacterium]
MAGAPGAVLNAVNDALAPFKARVTSQPITPEIVLSLGVSLSPQPERRLPEGLEQLLPSIGEDRAELSAHQGRVRDTAQRTGAASTVEDHSRA